MNLIEIFYEKMEKQNFEAYGMLDSQNRIHTFGTDSKIIGRIFEMFTQPVLQEIANENGYVLKTPESQTVYPDFILMKDEASKEKIAIDVKTTYIDKDTSSLKFTLGSFGSYMRNNTKNIKYSYTDYAKHYVIGFIYKRNGNAQERLIYDYDDRKKIEFPFYDVKYFIQEKYKIAGDKPGSGNTENIGSISSSNFIDFELGRGPFSELGRGPFSELGQDAYDLYWKYYPEYRAKKKNYTSLNEFLTWIQKQQKLELLHDFDMQAVQENVKAYILKHKL